MKSASDPAPPLSQRPPGSGREEAMDQPDRRDREIEALQERLSLLSAASRRINESLDFDQVLQGVLDSARLPHRRPLRRDDPP